MELNLKQDQDTLHISILGPVDDEDVSDFKEQLHGLISQSNQDVIFNLSMMPYICSSAIGRLLLFNKHVAKKNGRLRVKGVTDQVFELFRFTNLDLLFPIER